MRTAARVLKSAETVIEVLGKIGDAVGAVKDIIDIINDARHR